MEEAPTTNLWNSWIISGSNGLIFRYKCWIIWVENLWKSPIWWLKNRKISWEHYKELRPSERKSCRSFQPWKFDHMIRGCWRTSTGHWSHLCRSPGDPKLLTGPCLIPFPHVTCAVLFGHLTKIQKNGGENVRHTKLVLTWCLKIPAAPGGCELPLSIAKLKRHQW